MAKTLAVAVLCLSMGGCARVTTMSHQPAPREAPRMPMPAMERQVRNAIDAGEGDAIVRELRRRVLANPDDVRARIELAQRYLDQGFPELTIEHLRLAIARAPHLSELHIRLAKALQAVGNGTEAVETLVKFCNIDSLPPAELLSLLGIYEDNLGQFRVAEAHHRRAVELAPKRDVFHNNLGYNLLLQERPAEAAEEFRRAVVLNTRSEVARNNLGTAIALTPGADLSEAVLQWQSISDPATAHNNLASILMEQKRYPEARKELQLALSYSHGHTAALNNLALLGELDGQPASVVLASRPSTWHRLALGLRHALTGTKPEAQSGPAATPVEAATIQ